MPEPLLRALDLTIARRVEGLLPGRPPLVAARARQRARADPPLRAGRGRRPPDRLERDGAHGHSARPHPPRRAGARHVARARHLSLDDLRHGRAPQGRRRGGRVARDRLRRDPARQPPRPRRRSATTIRVRCRRGRDGPACSACCSPCARRRRRGERGERTARGATSVGEALRRVGTLARQRSYVVVVSDFRGPRDWRRPLLMLGGPPPRRGGRDPRRARAGAAEVRPAAPRRSRDRAGS